MLACPYFALYISPKSSIQWYFGLAVRITMCLPPSSPPPPHFPVCSQLLHIYKCCQNNIRDIVSWREDLERSRLRVGEEAAMRAVVLGYQSFRSFSEVTLCRWRYMDLSVHQGIRSWEGSYLNFGAVQHPLVSFSIGCGEDAITVSNSSYVRDCDSRKGCSRSKMRRPSESNKPSRSSTRFEKVG